MNAATSTVHEVPYPFVRETVSLPDIDVDGVGSVDVETWRPGTRYEPRSRYVGHGEYDESFDCIADGMGQMVLTVVSVHKPGKFPTRVFFTRQWVDPDGKRFGKGKLHVKSQAAFTEMTRGYRHRFNVKQAVAKDSAARSSES